MKYNSYRSKQKAFSLNTTLGPVLPIAKFHKSGVKYEDINYNFIRDLFEKMRNYFLYGPRSSKIPNIKIFNIHFLN